MEWWHAILLGIVEGITEFLPVSSTGHLTIVEKLLGYQINSPGITAFTAIVQLGAIAAAVLYFRQDIWRVGLAWFRGLFDVRARKDKNYMFGWAIIIGSIPIAVVGLVFKDDIETVLRSLWFVVAGLIGWSGVMWYADNYASEKIKDDMATWKQTLVIGLAQCFALIPGVSRSGATISASLLQGFDRVAATRLSFFLGIPALVAAGLVEALTQSKHISEGIGWGVTTLGILFSFVVGYMSIAWLLKFIGTHKFTLFIWYRVALGVVLALLLITGTISPV